MLDYRNPNPLHGPAESSGASGPSEARHSGDRAPPPPPGAPAAAVAAVGGTLWGEEYFRHKHRAKLAGLRMIVSMQTLHAQAKLGSLREYCQALLAMCDVVEMFNQNNVAIFEGGLSQIMVRARCRKAHAFRLAAAASCCAECLCEVSVRDHLTLHVCAAQAAETRAKQGADMLWSPLGGGAGGFGPAVVAERADSSADSSCTRQQTGRTEATSISSGSIPSNTGAPAAAAATEEEAPASPATPPAGGGCGARSLKLPTLPPSVGRA